MSIVLQLDAATNRVFTTSRTHTQKIVVGLGLISAVLGNPSRASAQFADSVTATHVAGSIYMLEGAGDVITASIGADGVLLVDDGFTQTTESVRNAIRNLGGGDPDIIINTHWHHAGANADFSNSATIIAHRLTRERLAEGATMYTQEMPPVANEALPDVIFDDSLSVFFNGEEIKLIHLPHAHTDTDIAVIFTESGVVSLGDVFVTLIPVTDFASGGDLYASADAIDYLIERLSPEIKIIPGHGKLASYEDLVEFGEMFTGMTSYVEGMIARGHSVETVIEAGIPDQWQSWMSDLLPVDFVLANFYEGVQKRR